MDSQGGQILLLSLGHSIKLKFLASVGIHLQNMYIYIYRQDYMYI